MIGPINKFERIWSLQRLTEASQGFLDPVEHCRNERLRDDRGPSMR
jgi:hypothetical protein